MLRGACEKVMQSWSVAQLSAQILFCASRRDIPMIIARIPCRRVVETVVVVVEQMNDSKIYIFLVVDGFRVNSSKNVFKIMRKKSRTNEWKDKIQAFDSLDSTMLARSINLLRATKSLIKENQNQLKLRS
jgi:hypothetical protein